MFPLFKNYKFLKVQTSILYRLAVLKSDGDGETAETIFFLFRAL